MLPDDPYLVGALIVIIAAALAYQRTLSWSEYRVAHRTKTILLPILQPRVTVLLVSSKAFRGGEYLTTVNDSLGGVFQTLVTAGGSPHLVCSIKERETPDGTRQYSAAHIVWLHHDGSQTEAYLFASPDGGVDIQSHHEPSVLSPTDHLDGRKQQNGDPRGVVWDALAAGYGVQKSN